MTQDEVRAALKTIDVVATKRARGEPILPSDIEDRQLALDTLKAIGRLDAPDAPNAADDTEPAGDPENATADDSEGDGDSTGSGTAALIDAAIAALAEDVGAVFEPDVLAALKKIRSSRPADWQRYRTRIKDAGGSVGELDRLTGVSGDAEDTGQGQAFAIESPEPWPEEVFGSIYPRFVVLPEHADIALALWSVHSYGYDYGRCTPILALTSPQKRCGKTTLLGIALGLVNKPLAASNISPSCVFRSIDKWKPTLLIDEADSFLKANEELRRIINSGQTREMAYVIRNVGEDHDPRQFSTWCPKAIALIGKLPPTLHDPAIEIPLVRKNAVETVDRLTGFDGEEIRRKCVRWVADHAGELREANPLVPPELHDRAADNWRPLFAIADLAGGDWPQRARAAAKALVDTDDDAESYSVMLLSDIRQLFDERNTDRLFSADIVEHFLTLEDRPWPQWGRSQKPITKNQVARLLKPFKIKPATVRGGGERAKGYKLEQFMDAFSRYTPIQTVTPCQPMPHAASGEIQTVTIKSGVTDRKPLNPAPHNDCHGVTDQKGGYAGTLHTENDGEVGQDVVEGSDSVPISLPTPDGTVEVTIPRNQYDPEAVAAMVAHVATVTPPTERDPRRWRGVEITAPDGRTITGHYAERAGARSLAVPRAGVFQGGVHCPAL